MPRKKNIVKLSDDQREHLAKLDSLNARALLACDRRDGVRTSDAAVARTLACRPRFIKRVRFVFCHQGLDAALTQAWRRKGRERTAGVVALSPADREELEKNTSLNARILLAVDRSGRGLSDRLAAKENGTTIAVCARIRRNFHRHGLAEALARMVEARGRRVRTTKPRGLLPPAAICQMANRTVGELLKMDHSPHMDAGVRYVVGEQDPNGARHVIATIRDFFDGEEDRALKFMRRFSGLILVMPDDDAVNRLLLGITSAVQTCDEVPN